MFVQKDIVSFETALTAGKHKSAAKRGRTLIYECSKPGKMRGKLKHITANGESCSRC